MLIDPFLTGNPKGAIAAEDVAATTILLTHGHATTSATRSRSPSARAPRSSRSPRSPASSARRASTSRDPNLGGTEKFDWGTVKLVPALAHLDHAEGHGQHRPPAC